MPRKIRTVNKSRKPRKNALVRSKALERKYNRYAVSNTLLTSTAFIAPLSNVATGTSQLTRIGYAIRLTHLLFRWHVFPSTLPVTTPRYARCILVIDHMPYGTDPLYGDVMVSFATGSAAIDIPNSDSKSKFTVIADLHADISAVNYGTQTQQVSIPLQNMRATFKGTSGASADLEKNHLYAIFISDVSVDKIYSSYGYQVTFTDD